MAVVQRSRDIYGPYEDCPHNPVLSNVKLHRYPVQAIGHADFVEDGKGNWWAVCLGIRLLDTQLRHNLGRETFLAKVGWENGWPVCGEAGNVHGEMSGPLPEAPKTPNFDIRDDFSGGRLALHWNHVRNPDVSRYRSDGGLVLCGGEAGLSDKHPVFAGVRQQSFFIEAATGLNRDINAGTRAGITAFLNEDYHYDLALERRADGLYVLVNRRIHDFEAVLFETKIAAAAEDVGLRIKADMGWYRFAYRVGGGDWQDAGRGMTAGLSAEGTHGGCFTGVYIGLYACGGEARFGCFSLLNLRPETAG